MSTATVSRSEPNVAPQVFKARREIQPRDSEGNSLGSPHVYEAEGSTQAEADQKVADKMASAIENGTLKIRELNLKVKNGGIEAPRVPEGAEVNENEIPEPKPRQLTDSERFQLAQDLKDPSKVDEAFDKLFEAKTGLKPQDVVRKNQTESRNTQKLAAVAEAEAFSRDNPAFYGCAENKKAMLDFMVSRNLKWTKKNLEIAFRELKADGLLAEEPREPEPIAEVVVALPRTEARQEPAAEVEVPKPEPRRPDKFPSAIRPSQASGADSRPKAKGLSAEQQAMLNPRELREYLQNQGLWGK